MIKWRFLTRPRETDEPAKYTHTRRTHDARGTHASRGGHATRGEHPQVGLISGKTLANSKNKEDERKIAGANYVRICKDNDK